MACDRYFNRLVSLLQTLKKKEELVSVLGGWHPNTAKELAKVGGVLGKDRSVVVAHLFQRLGVSLVWGCIPKFPHAPIWTGMWTSPTRRGCW